MITIDDFLSAFFPDENEFIRLRFIPPRGAPGYPLKRSFTRVQMHGDEEIKTVIRQMNQDHGVYFVVNAGGDTDAEISRYTAWFVECDSKPIEDQHKALDECPLQPSIRVQTKKSVHAYWLVEADCDEQAWRDIQARLIAYFDGDSSIKNLSRVMRIPYLNHLAYSDGEISRLKITLPHFDSRARFNLQQMKATFPPAHHAPVEMRYSTGSYPTWDALNSEARHRILAQPGCHINGEWAKCKGICHDGKSRTGLAMNVATGAYFCQADCDTAHVLRSLGLPEKPDNEWYGQKPVIMSAAPLPASSDESDPDKLPPGVYTVDDLSERIDALYERGLTPGESPGWVNFSQYYTVKPGQFTIITGVPGSGKTQLLDNMLVNLAYKQKWKFSVCSLENQPLEQHAATLLEIFSGEPFSGTSKMSVYTRDIAKDWLRKHFTFLLPTEENCTIMGLLEMAEAVRKKIGINGLVIDPWNEFEHRRPAMMTETQYTSDILSRIRRFGRAHDIHTWLVAHPTKLTKDKDGVYPIPTLYDISGSAHFRNKCDMGLVTWRDANNPSGGTVVYIQKVRFRWCGKLGSIEFQFNPVTGRYEEIAPKTGQRKPNPIPIGNNGHSYYEAREQEY